MSLTHAFSYLNLSSFDFLIDSCKNFFTHDRELFIHSLQVACLIDRVGLEVLSSQAEVQQASLAAILHDVGKTLIPAEIINKQGRLTPQEQQIMKEHTCRGRDLLLKIDSDSLSLAAKAALFHHERCDGRGYPHGITKEEMPLAIRLISICDAYSALRSSRAYKHPFSHERAVSILQEENSNLDSCKFDPDLLGLCIDRFANIRKTQGSSVVTV